MSSSASPLAELLADLHRALTALGLRWYLFGAQAAILHGVARLTADVDVTVEVAALPNALLVDRLAAAGFELRVPDAEGFVERTRVLPLVHARSRLPLDVVLAGPGLEELFFTRVEERTVGDLPVPVASAEDLVAMKILAGRGKDLDDIAASAHGPSPERVRSTLRLLEQALDRRDLLAEFERLLGQAPRPGRAPEVSSIRPAPRAAMSRPGQPPQPRVASEGRPGCAGTARAPGGHGGRPEPPISIGRELAALRRTS